jgi:arylsulfatase A-like enzyme
MRWPEKIRAGSVSSELVSSIDFMPTLAAVAGTREPQDRTIDGENLLPLMTGPETAKSPHEAFFYYLKDNLEAVRVANWKLHIRKEDEQVRELYDLSSDIAESRNLYEKNPDVVRRIEKHVKACRKDLGDAAEGIEGEGCRPCGRVENADTLTHFDPDHPYFIALYDLDDAG